MLGGWCLNIDVLSNADNLRLPIILPGATSLLFQKRRLSILGYNITATTVAPIHNNKIFHLGQASTLHNIVFIRTSRKTIFLNSSVSWPLVVFVLIMVLWGLHTNLQLPKNLWSPTQYSTAVTRRNEYFPVTMQNRF